MLLMATRPTLEESEMAIIEVVASLLDPLELGWAQFN